MHRRTLHPVWQWQGTKLSTQSGNALRYYGESCPRPNESSMCCTDEDWGNKPKIPLKKHDEKRNKIQLDSQKWDKARKERRDFQKTTIKLHFCNSQRTCSTVYIQVQVLTLKTNKLSRRRMHPTLIQHVGLVREVRDWVKNPIWGEEEAKTQTMLLSWLKAGDGN